MGADVGFCGPVVVDWLVSGQRRRQLQRRTRRVTVCSAREPWSGLVRAGGLRAALSTRFDRRMLTLAAPALGASIMEPLLMLVDSAFVATLGSAPLAALAPCNAVINLIDGLSYAVLTNAVTVVVSKLLASEDWTDSRSLIRLVTVGSVALGALLGVAVWLCSTGIVHLLGASASLAPYAVDYLETRALGLPFAFFALVGCGIFRALGETRTIFIASLVAGGCNLVLDTVLIVLLKAGIGGAGLATAASQAVAAGVVAVSLWRRKRELGFGRVKAVADVAQRASSLDPLSDLIAASSAVFIRQTCNHGLWVMAASVVTRLGEAAAATQQAILCLWLVLAFINDSVATAGQVLVAGSKFHREGAHTASARSIAWRATTMSLMLAVVLIPVGCGLQGLVMARMLGDPETLALANRVFPAVLAFLPLHFAVWTMDSLYFGASDFSYNALAVGTSAAVSATLLVLAGNSLLSVWMIMTVAFFGLRLVMHVRRFCSGSGPFLLPRAPAVDVAAAADVVGGVRGMERGGAIQAGL